MVQISSVLIREIRVYPCPDFKLSGSQIVWYKQGDTLSTICWRFGC